MARNPAPFISPRDPILGALKGFLDWVHRRLDDEIPVLLTGTKANWNPPAVADAASTSTTVVVRGVANDLKASPVMVAITQALPAGCSITGAVTGVDEVTVSLLNLSGGVVNVAAIAETRVTVWRYGA